MSVHPYRMKTSHWLPMRAHIEASDRSGVSDELVEL